MEEYNVKIQISSGMQESLVSNELFDRQWRGTMHIKGMSHEYHTSGKTADQVINTIGIELICMLKAAYQEEKKQNGD